MIPWLVRTLSWHAALWKAQRLAGHDWTPGEAPLHHSTCPCGLGLRIMLYRRDWRALAEHPVPSRP